MKLQAIIEKGDDTLYGRIKGNKLFTPVTSADTKEEVIANLKMLIADYQQHEGKDDRFWNKINIDTVEFDITYDLQAFFQEHDFLNASAIARHAEMNESLVRQYAAGKKFPSATQAKKIQETIHFLLKPLQRVSLYAEA